MGGTAVRVSRDHEELSLASASALSGLVGYFRAKGVRTEDARDLAHETVLRTLVHLDRHGRTRSDLRPLTKTIARNLLVERLRKRNLSVVPLSEAVDIADDALEPAELALSTERTEAVQQALRSLAPRQRRVVELWMEGRSPAEIARELGIKRNAADALLHRARRALASKLGPRALWGAVVLAWFRARAGVRDAAQTMAAWSPTSAPAAPVGVCMVVLGLAAVLSVGGTSSESRPATTTLKAARTPVSTIVTEGVQASPPKTVSPAKVAGVPSVPGKTQTELAIGVGGDADEQDPIVVGVALRPDEDGERGTVGPVLDDVLKDACTGLESACKESR